MYADKYGAHSPTIPGSDLFFAKGEFVQYTVSWISQAISYRHRPKLPILTTFYEACNLSQQVLFNFQGLHWTNESLPFHI